MDCRVIVDSGSGQWQNDQMHGRGRFCKSNGTVEEGNWINGAKVQTGFLGAIRSFLG